MYTSLTCHQLVLWYAGIFQYSDYYFTANWFCLLDGYYFTANWFCLLDGYYFTANWFCLLDVYNFTANWLCLMATISQQIDFVYLMATIFTANWCCLLDGYYFTANWFCPHEDKACYFTTNNLNLSTHQYYIINSPCDMMISCQCIGLILCK